jgi:hypothetical protein
LVVVAAATDADDWTRTGTTLSPKTAGDVVTVSAGTAAAPGLAVVGDPDTGIYSPGADQVAISTGGSGRLFVDASGNVGIGTASPFSSDGRNLHVLSTDTARLWLESTATSTGRQFYIESANTGGLNVIDETAGQNRLSITAAGLIGVNTTGAGANIDVRPPSGNGASLRLRNSPQSDGSPNSIIVGVDSTAFNGVAYIDTSKVGVASVTPLAFKIDGSERARIDSSGRLLVGSSAARAIGGGLQANTGSQLFIEGGAGDLALSTFVLNRNDTNPASIVIGKSRGTAAGGSTVLQNKDFVGRIVFAGADGTDVDTPAAFIEAAVDGTPGADVMPGRLGFSTTAAGAASPTERLGISSTGAVTINNLAGTGVSSVGVDASGNLTRHNVSLLPLLP